MRNWTWRIVNGEDIHVITGALKMFFRELPEPLFRLIILMILLMLQLVSA